MPTAAWTAVLLVTGRKPARLCPVHCYKRDMRERMRQVMRYAGPRMLWVHPVAALRHVWREFCSH